MCLFLVLTHGRNIYIHPLFLRNKASIVKYYTHVISDYCRLLLLLPQEEYI